MEVQVGTQTEEDNETNGIINQTTKLYIQITLTIPENLQQTIKYKKLNTHEYIIGYTHTHSINLPAPIQRYRS